MHRTKQEHSARFRAGRAFVSCAVAVAALSPFTSNAAAVAHASLAAASGSQLSGSVTLTQTADGVHLEGQVAGLTPGVHGFHVHEVGDCSAPDASSAKGHFNPLGRPHGQHAGDLPDLTADAQGLARIDVVVKTISLSEGPNGVVNRALIVHADPDDHISQPAGNAGKRVGCAVITAQ